MIQMQTKLVVADNTGAKEVAMIRRLGQHSRTAAVGDVIVVAVKSSTPDAAVKKGTVAKAVVVRTKAPIRRSDGSYRYCKMKQSVKKGEEVVVISGSAKGSRGKVLAVFPAQERVIVEGVNIRKYRERKSQKNPEGGTVEREAPIHISNVMLAGRFDAKKTAKKA